MGGRGSAGGAFARNNAFKMPELSGTEKQISWAKEIIQKAMDTIDNNMKLEEDRAKKYGIKDSQSYKDSIATWKEVKRQFVGAYSGKSFNARSIIDQREGTLSPYRIIQTQNGMRNYREQKRSRGEKTEW